MSVAHAITEGLYISDILEQAEVLEKTLSFPLPSTFEGFKHKLRSAQSPFVILTGMGSSFHALRPLSVRLAAAGIRPLLLETSELVYYYSDLLNSETPVIAVSQSGRSAEMVRLVEVNAGRSPILCVTNDPDSPLARGSLSLILIRAGVEATVSCKTYTCTLLALSRIGEELCDGDMTRWDEAACEIPAAVDRYLHAWRAHVEELCGLLQRTQQMILVGRGFSLATTGAGGLIIKEAARFHAEGMSSAAFRHGPLEMVSNRLFVLVFKGDERSAELNTRIAFDVSKLGGESALVSEDSLREVFHLQPTIDALRPILEMLPVQMITLALAAREGREAGSFVHVTKVTATE